MRTTIKLRLLDEDQAEEFEAKLREFLNSQEHEVRMNVNNGRWTSYGCPNMRYLEPDDRVIIN